MSRIVFPYPTDLSLFSMIQRIQSIYLLLAITVLTLTFFLPVWAWSIGTEVQSSYLLYKYGISTSQPGYSAPMLYPVVLSFFAVLSIVLYGWSFFSFRKLGKAITLVVLALFSTVAYLAFLGFIIYDMSTTQQLSGNIPQLGTLFPAIAFVLGIMALRAMRRDQALLRSADRIR